MTSRPLFTPYLPFSAVWKKFGGYFIGTGRIQLLFDETSTELSSQYGLTVFINNTIIGSRLYSHRIEITSLADIFYTDTFGTTTYDKDGKLSFTYPDPSGGGNNVFDAYPGMLQAIT